MLRHVTFLLSCFLGRCCTTRIYYRSSLLSVPLNPQSIRYASRLHVRSIVSAQHSTFSCAHSHASNSPHVQSPRYETRSAPLHCIALHPSFIRVHTFTCCCTRAHCTATTPYQHCKCCLSSSRSLQFSSVHFSIATRHTRSSPHLL